MVFGIGNSAWIVLRLYDMLGREVKTLVNERLQAGHCSLQWDGTNDAGQPVARGVYLYRLSFSPLKGGLWECPDPERSFPLEQMVLLR
ncbi:MAG: hypothetical protein D6748_06570 [Calditrichaeota bacterium]|nr:MAG: hypothetical protein D6748_06570 [Calditrichota bacterium]